MAPSVVMIVVASLITIAAAAPAGPPDLSTCYRPTLLDGTPLSLSCCLPTSNTTIIDYEVPARPLVLRTRRPAHLLDSASLQKYKNAIAAMRNLSSDDPWYFMQQASIHCAYCNGAYRQAGYTNIPYQVHFNWLFFPFHRAYLYFYERILGKLINDDTFALPFWNWDNSAGMAMPNIFTDTTSPLYDQYRDAQHQPPNIADFEFAGTDTSNNQANLTFNNLRIMYKSMFYANTPELFLGQPYRAGDQSAFQGAGSIELQPHNNMHAWSGDRSQTYNEDMGNFYSAGRDPMFYSHHANVDRMWSIWTTLPNHTNYNDADWLDASFYFWDENRQLVRIRVRDVVDTSALGYQYAPVTNQWLLTPPKPAKPLIPLPTSGLRFPVNLESVISINVSRPTGLTVALQEVLVIENITIDAGVYTKFDVYINADSSVTAASSEFAGSFVYVPMGTGTMTVQRMELGIATLLVDVGAADSSVIVTLAPRTKGSSITLEAVRIDALSISV